MRLRLREYARSAYEAATYAVVLEPQADGGYTVHIPAFHGAHTQGQSLEECLANARDVIELHLEVMAERDEELPESDVAQTITVSLPSLA